MSLYHLLPFHFVLIAGLVAGCVPSVDAPLRDTSAPISATSRFDAQAFAGNWQVVARFVATGPATLAVREGTTPDQLRLASAEIATISGLYRQGVAGELIPVVSGQDKLIVLWVDEDFETAAIGTPSGSFGAVLDRDGNLPADRAQAARDIFEFYGWNVSALQWVTR